MDQSVVWFSNFVWCYSRSIHLFFVFLLFLLSLSLFLSSVLFGGTCHSHLIIALNFDFSTQEYTLTDCVVVVGEHNLSRSRSRWKISASVVHTPSLSHITSIRVRKNEPTAGTIKKLAHTHALRTIPHTHTLPHAHNRTGREKEWKIIFPTTAMWWLCEFIRVTLLVGV